MFDAWKENPPVNLAFMGFLRGLEASSRQPRTWQEALRDIPSNENVVAEIAAKAAPGAMPVSRRRDPMADKMKPTFDVAEMETAARARMAQRAKAIFDLKKASGGA